MEIGVDRVGALDVQHAREHAAADRALDLGGAAADLHGARRGALDAEQERRHVDRHPLREGELEVLGERHVVGRGRHQLLDLRAAAARVVGGREDRKEPAGKPAAAGLRQVDMARGLAVEEGALGLAAAPEQPQENVVMAVEDGDRVAGHGSRGSWQGRHL